MEYFKNNHSVPAAIKTAEEIAREAVSLRHYQLLERKARMEKKLEAVNQQLADCYEYLRNNQREISK